MTNGYYNEIIDRIVFSNMEELILNTSKRFFQSQIFLQPTERERARSFINSWRETERIDELPCFLVTLARFIFVSSRNPVASGVTRVRVGCTITL